MKKMFTLFLALGMLAVAQAQPGNRDNRQPNQRNDQRDEPQFEQKDLNFNDGYDNDGFDRNGRYLDKFSIERRMKMEIARINREYDYKIQKVKRNFFMNWFEKQRQIRFLEEQRQREIRKVYAKYDNRRGRHNDRDRHDW